MNLSAVTNSVRQMFAPRKQAAARGANFVGYLRAATGMGEAGRSTVRALRALEYPLWTHTLSEATSEQAASPQTARGPYPFNLCQFNADMTPHILGELGEPFTAGRKNIGLWSWEMSEFPTEWQDRFGSFKEIWVPSTHIRRALERVAPVPVRAMPHVVEPAATSQLTRANFGLPPDKYIFLFAFDALSIVARKNPFAVIEAYRRAFGNASPDTLLVLKVNNRALLHGETARHLGVDENFGAQIADAVAGVSGMFLDRRMERADVHALISLCDCYVSLHRCEGFGLTLAEAMYFGKPCIATGYSANLDFMHADNSYLVRYRLVELERDYGPYRAGWAWAEPDIDHAAEWMQCVAREPAEANARGQCAARDIHSQLNARAVGAEMVTQLDKLAVQP